MASSGRVPVWSRYSPSAVVTPSSKASSGAQLLLNVVGQLVVGHARALQEGLQMLGEDLVQWVFFWLRRQYECAWVGGQVPGMVLTGQQHAIQSVLAWLRAWAWPFLWVLSAHPVSTIPEESVQRRGQRRMHAPHG